MKSARADQRNARSIRTKCCHGRQVQRPVNDRSDCCSGIPVIEKLSVRTEETLTERANNADPVGFSNALVAMLAAAAAGTASDGVPTADGEPAATTITTAPTLTPTMLVTYATAASTSVVEMTTAPQVAVGDQPRSNDNNDGPTQVNAPAQAPRAASPLSPSLSILEQATASAVQASQAQSAATQPIVAIQKPPTATRIAAAASVAQAPITQAPNSPAPNSLTPNSLTPNAPAPNAPAPNALAPGDATSASIAISATPPATTPAGPQVTTPVVQDGHDETSRAATSTALSTSVDNASQADATAASATVVASSARASSKKVSAMANETTAPVSNTATTGLNDATSAAPRSAIGDNVGASTHTQPLVPNSTGVYNVDRIRYVQAMAPNREVQRLALDLDGARVAVRFEGGRASLAVVSDPTGSLGKGWVRQVERTIDQTVRANNAAATADAGTDGRHGQPSSNLAGDQQQRRQQHASALTDTASEAERGQRWAEATRSLVQQFTETSQGKGF